MHPAHTTFDTRGDADTFLGGVRSDIARQVYVCPVEQRKRAEAERRARQTFREYAEPWLERRKKPSGEPLAPRTRLLYRRQLDELLETFGDVPLDGITRAMVRKWWQHLPEGRLTGNAHVYGLLRTILATAVDDEFLPSNPCTIKGAGQSKRQRPELVTPTLDQLSAMVKATPAHYRMMVQLAAWCALRYGEVVELRRGDVAEDGSVIDVRRGATFRDGKWWVRQPKADSAGRLAVPPHLRADLLAHLRSHGQPGPDGLLFPSARGRVRKGECGCGYLPCTGGHLQESSAQSWWRKARAAGKRPDLHFHDLRHFGLTMYAQTGAGVPEIMARGRHKSVAAAQRYWHVAQGRQDELVANLSALVTGKPVKAKRKARKATAG